MNGEVIPMKTYLAVAVTIAAGASLALLSLDIHDRTCHKPHVFPVTYAEADQTTGPARFALVPGVRTSSVVVEKCPCSDCAACPCSCYPCKCESCTCDLCPDRKARRPETIKEPPQPSPAAKALRSIPVTFPVSLISQGDAPAEGEKVKPLRGASLALVDEAGERVVTLTPAGGGAGLWMRRSVNTGPMVAIYTTTGQAGIGFYDSPNPKGPMPLALSLSCDGYPLLQVIDPETKDILHVDLLKLARDQKRAGN